MLSSVNSVRRISRGAAVIAACSAVACVDYGNDHVAVDNEQEPPASVAEAVIDPDERIDVVAGEGAGVFIEHESGGLWHLFATCDTELSGYACEWDVVMSVAPGERIEAVTEDDFEPDDAVQRIDPGAIRLFAVTDTDFDGVYFEAPPESTVRFDVLLDGEEVPRFVNWVGQGALNRGAPSNPVDLTPSVP